MEWNLALYLAGLLAAYFIWRKYKRYKHLPPGPRGLPLLGNMFQMDPTAPHQTLAKWAREFGDIYTINLLGQDRVVLSGEYIREATVTKSDVFAGRPRLYVGHEILQKGVLSVVTSTFSERWVRMKKAVMTSVKAYGEGLKRIEDLTIDAAEEMIKTLDLYNGEAMDPQDAIHHALVKIVYSLIFAEKLSDSETRFVLETHKRASKLTAIGGDGTMLEALPWLRYVKLSYVKKLEKVFDDLQSVLRPAIMKKKVEQDDKDCIVNAFLNHSRKAEKEGDVLTDLELQVLAFDTLFAGLATSSSALYSLLSLCVSYPDVMSRIQSEIDDVIGTSVPTLDVRQDMPYVNAVLLELLRLISHVPLSVPHATTQEVEIGGYTLPKGQEIWLNLWSLHHDERYWDEPYVFKPERFLTSEGDLVPAGHVNRRRLMVFGAGRRVCLGESLAKSRLFLLICHIFQRFDLKPSDSDNLPNSDPREYKAAFILRPEDYKVRFVPRLR